MKKLLFLALCCQIYFASNASGQVWCWAQDVVGLVECGSDQNASADNYGNLYTFSAGATSIVHGGVTITGNSKYIVKHKTGTGTIDWIIGGTGGTVEGTLLKNDAAGNLYVYCDSNHYTTQYYNLIKMDSFGNQIWTRTGSLTGGGNLLPKNIAYDNAGHMYISGYISGTQLVAGGYTLTNPGHDSNSYVIKYDTSGNVIWAKLISSPNYVMSPSIATDPAGDLFISAVFHSPDSLTILDTTVAVPAGGDGIFVAKFDSGLNFKWMTANHHFNDLGVLFDAFIEGELNIVTADGPGNAYLAGSYEENDTIGTIPISFDMNHNNFIAKYDNNGGQVEWAKTGGNLGDAGFFNFVTNASGSSYGVYMSSSATTYFGDSIIHLPAGSFALVDATILSLDSSGNILCGTMLGGEAGDDMCGLAVDNNGICYVVGDYDGPCQFGDTTLNSPGAERYFAARYSCHCTCAGNPPIPTAVSISASFTDTVCAGTRVTFIALPTGGVPPSYQWIVNGTGTPGSSTFSYIPSNGDSVVCVIGNGEPCAPPYALSSNVIYMAVKGCNVGTPMVNKLPLRIYPNPASNELYIQMADGAYDACTITNSVGQVFLAQQITSSQTTVDISRLTSGLYYITLRGDGGSVVSKFVKM